MNRLTIVVVMVLEERKGQTFGGRPYGPQRIQRTAQAATWLLRGSDEDMKAAVAWAAREGFQAYAYPASEPDPLGRGRADALAAAAALDVHTPAHNLDGNERKGLTG